MDSEIVNQDFLIELINDIEEFIFYKDSKFIYRFANQAFLKFLNKSYTDVIGKTDYDLFDISEAELIRNYDTDVRNNLLPIKFELLITGFNKQIWTEVNKYPIIKDGVLKGIKSVVRDITSTKHKQHIIEENEKILQNFFDSGSDMRGVVEIVGNDIKHIFDNLNTIKFFGLQQPDFTKNKYASEIGIPANHIKMWLKHYLLSKQTNKPIQFEYEHYNNNAYYILCATVSYLGTEPNGFDRFAYIVEDITKRKHIEKTIIESESRYRAIFEGSNDGIVVADGQSGKIIYANNNFSNMFGYKKDELMALHFQDLHPESFKEDATKNFTQANGIDNRVMMNIPCLKKDNKLFYCDVKDSKVIISGRVCNLAFFTNVMGRRKIESVLYRHNLAIEASANGIVITDKDGIISYVNSTFESMTGFSSEEAIGKNPRELVKSGMNNEYVYKDLWDTIKNGHVWKGEIINKKKNGEIYYEDMTITPFYDNLENEIYYIAVKTNITEKILTQKALKETNALLKNLSTRIPGAIFQYQFFPDGKSCFPYASERIWEIYEVTPDMIIQDASLVFSRIHPEDLEAVNESIKYSAQNLSPWRFDYRVILPEKGLRWLRGSSMPEKLNDESILWHGYIYDITERKEQEFLLIESEKKFRSYIKNSPIGIFISNENGQYLDVNKSACLMLGYDYEELIQLSIPQIISEMSLSVGLEHFNQLQKIGYSIGEVLLKRKDGSEFWANIEATKLDDNKYIAYCSDVTEKREQIEKIKQLSFEYEKVFNGAQISLYLVEVIDSNHFKYIRNNKIHQLKRGISLKEIAGKTPVELLGYEIGTKLENLYKKCVEKKETLTFDDKLLFDNQERHWQTTLTPIFENESIKFIVGSSVDLTDLKNIENALLVREEQLLTLINSTPDIICFKDSKSRWLEANKAQLELFQLSNIDYHNKSDAELAECSPFYRQSLLNCMDSDEIAWQNGKTSRGMEIINTPIGIDKYYDIIKVPLFDEFNQRKGLVVLGRDITERIEIEKKNSESYARLWSLLETMEQGVIYENKNRQIIFVNQTYCNLFRIEGNTSIIGFDSDFISEKTKKIFKDPNSFILNTSKIINNKQLVTNEVLELINGKFYERDYIPVIFNNELQGNYWIFRDITERKIAEHQLRKMFNELKINKEIIETNLYQKNSLIEELTKIRYELEKSNAEKDKFFSIISHDLRSPFSGFLGLTQIFAEQFEDLSMENLMEIGNSMHNSASNLYRLLENLLEWSKMTQENIDFNPELISINKLISQTINVNKTTADLKKISIINNINEEIFAYIDVRMIETVLRNIFTNAIKFSNKGGIIQINAISKDDFIQISIADNGIGMDKDLISKLFIISEKTNRLGTDGELSSGLGLILCKEFIEKHNGKLWVESEDGIGSTFNFLLPRNKI